ncbi:Ger(x)C family spore germination protein [Paenibacillus sp.]|uniref:Ger(x)C family spore germination protein n=1 Tax=Paenibacillus sp. TaxID=58172 RepID=UPI002D512CDA|nr:Ger(x)C family spore germination protein [Paenibacillus sp.]HZG86637.1 Ger(x)C family spore germination protein [Paenibacillus sp.]
MMLRRAALALLALALLPGCWDQKELNEVAVVIGVGVDQGEKQRFEVTAQVIKPTAQAKAGGGGGSELPTWSLTASGETFLDAISELNRISPRRLYWPHLQIIIFGEELAKEGIAPVITWFEKSRDSRSGTYVVVTRGRAEDILNKRIELGNIPAKAMADMIANAEIRQLPARKMTLRKLTGVLSSPGVDIAVDVIDPREIRGKVEAYSLEGAAVFDKDRLVEYITDEAVHGLAIAHNTYANTTIKARCPRDGSGYVTFQVTDFRSQLKVTVDNGKITGTFDIFVEGNLLDQTCKGSLMEETQMVEVERAVADRIESLLTSMYERAAAKGSDVYGIGRELRRHYPKVWRKLEPEWEKTLREVRITAEIDANIRRSGLVIDPTINKME